MESKVFNLEIINEAKSNWLFKAHPDAFEDCKTGGDICFSFLKLSNNTGLETGLYDKIADIIISNKINN